ncbi:MAG: ribosomal-protein-alanine N-acetyltransferase [Pseudohongiellaceae bacterium]|jgi:ribosomal-protein-alanine N-acetyltransferase
MTTNNYTNEFYIREVSAKETYTIRHAVLRKGRPIEDCQFRDDALETTIHIGIYIDAQVVGIATFVQNKNKLFSEEKQYQLRGMAILEIFQGRQLGERLLNYGEQMLEEKHIARLWFNARETAVGFYKKNNYETVGLSFEIDNVGTHYVMTKIL